MPPGAIRFTADASQLKSESSAAAKSVASVAASAEEARKRIVASYQMQVAAAKEVGASQRELEAITRRSSSMLSQVTDDSANRYIKSLQRMEDQTRKFNAARQQLAAVVPVAAADAGGHGNVTDQQRASALLRAGGGTFSIRAGEQFASQFSAFNAISGLVFPVVGATVFAAEIGRGAAELIKMKKEADELPDHIRNAFDEFNSPLLMSVDSLRKTNDELEIAIARIEHKPENTLALALDEARLNADRLADSTNKATDNIKKLLAENKAGFGTFLLNGQVGTGVVSDEVNKRMQELRDLQRTNRDAIRSGSDTPGAAAGRETAINQRLEDLYKWANTTRTQIQSFTQGGKNQGNINILEGVEDYSSNTLDEVKEQKRNAVETARLKQLEIQKNLSQAALEERRKAEEAQQHAWDSQYTAFTSSADKTIAQERKFWFDRLNVVSEGTKNYEYAQRKADDLLRQMNEQSRKQAEERRKLNDQYQQTQLNQLQAALNPGAVAQSKGIENAQTTGIALRDAQRSAAFSGDDAGINAELQAGRISKLNAAMQLQTLHSKEYSAQLAELRENLAAVKSDDPNAVAKQNEFNTSIAELGARRQQQSIRDSAAVNLQGSSAGVGFRDALDDFVRASMDAAGQMRSIAQGILSGINQNLSSAIVGGRTDWAGTFRGVGQSVANVGLQRIEGSALGALGLGKADGSSSNPFYVRSVDGIGGIGSIAGAITGSAGGFGKFLSKAIGWLPGRAIGGIVDAGTSYMVGEKGPEVLTLGASSGRIAPNSQIGGGSGIGAIHIDARGATDPAATAMMVQQAIAAAAPHIMAASVSAVSERSSRRPLSSAR